MKSTPYDLVPSGIFITDSTSTLREENDWLRAELAYKKMHALIRARRPAAPTKRV